MGAEFVEKLKSAASCVPMVRAVRVFVVDAHGTKREVTLDELKEMDIKAQPVPNLYKRAAASSSGAGSSGATDVANVLQRQAALEEQLAAMKALMEKMAASSSDAAAAGKRPRRE